MRAVAALAAAVLAALPFRNSDLAIATAAYEHDDEAARSPVAQAIGHARDPDSVDWTRSRGTQA